MKVINREIVPGGLYRHFKGGLCRVIGTAEHTESGKKVVIYADEGGKLWARPITIFLSEVDRVKYPDEIQHYRFELVEED